MPSLARVQTVAPPPPAKAKEAAVLHQFTVRPRRGVPLRPLYAIELAQSVGATAFSPDGAYVVVTDFRRTSYVKLVPVCGGSAVTFSTPNNFWTAFNGDGELLFWDQTGAFSIGSISGDVRSIGVGLDNLAALPVLSPDHQWIAVSRPLHVPGCFNCISLEIVSSTTGESWIVGDQHGAMPVWGFGFSPDSTLLLTIGAVRRTNNSSTDSGGDLSVVPITGGAPTVLEHNVDGAGWVDSRHIAFQRNQIAGINLRYLP